MKCLIFKPEIIILIIFCLKNSYGAWKVKRASNMFNSNNNIFTLQEDLQVDGLEEDSSFKGGIDVKRWIVLSSFYDTYLIGIKERGLSLISISKRSGSLFQAVEKQIDLGKNITSVVAFNYINPNTQRQEGVVVASTNTPRHEIIWFKIYNYKLVKFWSWIRYAGIKSLHHFNVMREDMLVVLDSNGLTAYIYSLSFSTPTPKIRELEILPFSQKVKSLSTSKNIQEPILFVLHEGGLGIYTYKRFCSETTYGSFSLHTVLTGMGITEIYPFHSEGREYLAIAGKESGILRIGPFGNVNQEMKYENIIEWIVMKTGPNEERILLFGKTSNGKILVFSNVGHGWTPYNAPPCYKYNKGLEEKTDVQPELACIKSKSWFGVVSLEIGDLPTLIFGNRSYYGEIFHVMLSMSQDIIPLDQNSFTEEYEFYNSLLRIKNNLKDTFLNIGRSKSSDSICNIVDMISAIEELSATAKKRITDSCPQLLNSTLSMIDNYNVVDSSEKLLGQSKTKSHFHDVENNKKIEFSIDTEKEIPSQKDDFSSSPRLVTENPFKTTLISPDLENNSELQGLNSISGDFNMNMT